MIDLRPRNVSLCRRGASTRSRRPRRRPPPPPSSCLAEARILYIVRSLSGSLARGDVCGTSEEWSWSRQDFKRLSLPAGALLEGASFCV